MAHSLATSRAAAEFDCFWPCATSSLHQQACLLWHDQAPLTHMHQTCRLVTSQTSCSSSWRTPPTQSRARTRPATPPSRRPAARPRLRGARATLTAQPTPPLPRCAGCGWCVCVGSETRRVLGGLVCGVGHHKPLSGVAAGSRRVRCACAIKSPGSSAVAQHRTDSPILSSPAPSSSRSSSLMPLRSPPLMPTAPPSLPA